MKHLLNNISEEEKQSILEQHKGGMKVFNENFNKMVNKKLGHADLYEQSTDKNKAEEFRRTKGVKLDLINNAEELERWLSFDRGDLAYKELTGNDLGNSVDSEYEQRMDLLLRELMTFIAQTCRNYKECVDGVRYGNLVDNFFKRKDVKTTYNIEPFKYQGKVNLEPFKKYLARQVQSKLDSLKKS